MDDLKFAFHQLLRNLGFTVVAVRMRVARSTAPLGDCGSLSIGRHRTACMILLFQSSQMRRPGAECNHEFPSGIS